MNHYDRYENWYKWGVLISELKKYKIFVKCLVKGSSKQCQGNISHIATKQQYKLLHFQPFAF